MKTTFSVYMCTGNVASKHGSCDSREEAYALARKLWRDHFLAKVIVYGRCEGSAKERIDTPFWRDYYIREDGTESRDGR